MKLSEHLKEVEAWIAAHGDIQIQKIDAEHGPCDLEGPEIGRLIDNEVLFEYAYNHAVTNVKNEAEQMAILDDIWDKMPEKLRNSWKSRERYNQILSVSYERARQIVAEWDTAPKVILV